MKGEFAEKISRNKNTILETLSLLRKRKKIKNFYKVILKKNIPVFGGLGGGSSNAFYIFKYLSNKKKIYSNDKFLGLLAKNVSSDIPLFLNKQTFQKSLKSYFKFKKNLTFFFVLVFPHISSSTKKIYSKVKKIGSSSLRNIDYSADQMKFRNMILRQKNDLQLIVEREYPQVKVILRKINNEKGCLFSRVSGSGSTCYGLFTNKKSALVATKNLKKKFPKYWCVNTKTI